MSRDALNSREELLGEKTRREELMQKHPEDMTDEELIEWREEHSDGLTDHAGNPYAFEMKVMDEIEERGLDEETLPDGVDTKEISSSEEAVEEGLMEDEDMVDFAADED